MNAIKTKFQSLSSKERTQIWVLIVFSILAAYAFYAASVWEQMFHVQKMANRKADRIEKRIGNITPPELEEGVSEPVLKRLQKEIGVQEKQLKSLAAPLLPASDSAAREELKLKVTQLANLNHLRLASLKSVGFSEVKPVETLKGEELRHFFESRPVFLLTMSGQYANLLNFVEGLKLLPYQIYVSELSVTRLSAENSLLKIEVKLNL